MEYSLFLDDERFPKTPRKWNIVRSVEEAKEYVLKNGCPSYISFDNDLQQKLEGIDFAHWLVEHDMDHEGCFIPKDFEFNVHSANVPASARIQSLLSPASNLKNMKKQRSAFHPADSIRPSIYQTR